MNIYFSKIDEINNLNLMFKSLILHINDLKLDTCERNLLISKLYDIGIKSLTYIISTDEYVNKWLESDYGSTILLDFIESKDLHDDLCSYVVNLDTNKNLKKLFENLYDINIDSVNDWSE